MQGSAPSPKRLLSPSDLAAHIDHTLLRADATLHDIDILCDEALRFGFKGVCVNSNYVAHVAKRLVGSSSLAVSVVGFPLGAALTEAKARETELAIQAGASEIDMVIALGYLKMGDVKAVEADIRAVVNAARGFPVKVILETGLLTKDELTDACRASESAGAAFVKTATGFLGRGATVEDVECMRANISTRVQIKASGGVKTFEQARALLDAGASRLGTSSGVALVTGNNAPKGAY